MTQIAQILRVVNVAKAALAYLIGRTEKFFKTLNS